MKQSKTTIILQHFLKIKYSFYTFSINSQELQKHSQESRYVSIKLGCQNHFYFMGHISQVSALLSGCENTCMYMVSETGCDNERGKK